MVEGQLSCHLLQTVSIQKHERILSAILTGRDRTYPELDAGVRE